MAVTRGMGLIVMQRHFQRLRGIQIDSALGDRQWHDHVVLDRRLVWGRAVLHTISAGTVEGSGGSWSVALRRNIFSPEEATQLEALAEKLGEWNGQLGSERDQPRWSLKPTEGFSVKRYYTWRLRHLTPVSLACMNPNNIWKPKIPRKIKVFLWLLSHERLLKRVYRSKWREGDPIQCALCGLAPETVAHLFYECHWAQELWGMAGDTT
ncbi:hypothetical protein QJS10_CPB17g00799 [Acorus calamus]|uniref:Reverse transcriptase zinc-binding domain-containing protein n=1 Tax=Acorus calamus TaxID=4465 RepID=A0AAV9CSR1_ACOCL|nr:hypothetical protein QJS10_CPB17g00799 [Acorus calamus]